MLKQKLKFLAISFLGIAFLLTFFDFKISKIFPASAATESVSIIRQDCAGYSSCYTSLSAWEAAQQRDLVTSDEIAVARIEGTWTNPDTAAVTIDGWTTGPNNYIKIYTAPEARHSGVWDTGKYRLEVTNNDAIYNNIPHTIIDGLQVKLSGTFVRYGIKSPNIATISNSLILINNTNGHGIGTAVDFAGAWKAYNNIIYKDVSVGGNGIYAYGANINAYIYNNTIRGFNNCIYTSYQRTTAKNNIVENCTDGFNGTFTSGSDYNISNLASDAPGSNSKNSTTVSFIDTASGNFHIASSDTAAMNAGIDLSSDLNSALTTDIDSETRSGAWDIGADEYVGASQGGGTPPPPSDTAAPTRSGGAPSGALAAGTIQAILTLATNENATCKYGTAIGTAYNSIANTFSTTGGTSHTASIPTQNGQSYSFYVKCVDGSGNSNTDDYSISFSVDNPVADTSSPSAPTNLSATPISSSQINLSWAASNDNVSVTGYKVFRNGIHIATTTAANYSDTGLTASTAYSYAVAAFDAAGNNSAQTTSVNTATLSGSETIVSSLPFNITTAGSYVLAGDLNLDAGNAITISANNVVLSGAGKTITYANTGQGYGIIINANVTSLEIKNINLVQGNYDPTTNERVHAIYRSGNFSGIKIHDSNIYINHSGSIANAYGYGIHLVNNTGTSTNNEIYSNNLVITGTSVGRGISTSMTNSQWGSIHDNKVSLINLGSVPAGYPRAVSIEGNGGIDIYNNEININPGSSIAQGISLWNADNNTIRNNTINAAGVNSRAILVDGNSDNNKIYSNTINLTSNNTTSDNTSGIRIRFGSDNNEIYSNTIDGNSCTGNCFLLRVGESGGLGVPENNTFHHNILSGRNRAISLEGASLNTNFYLNTINSSSNNTIFFYGTAAETITNAIFSHENFTQNKYVLMTGIAGQQGSTGTQFCQSGLAETNVSANTGTHTWRISTSTCPFGETATQTQIQDTAPPTISSIQGTTAINTATITWTTNEPADSQIEYGITTSYGQTTAADMILMTSHSANITNLSPNTTYNYRVISRDSAGNTAISQNRTFATASAPDTAAPTAISNLTASNISQSSLALVWTAPSDNSGVASYDLRYSTSPITDTNFSSATAFTALPTPRSAGFVEQYIAVGLTPGTTYYFAIKSTDSAGNASSLSNMVNATTASAPSTTSPTPSTNPGTISVSTPIYNGGSGLPTNNYTVYRVTDSTAPGSPANAKINATDGQISLSWTNPADSDFVRVKILRKTDAYSTSATDGIIIYGGKDTSFVDTRLNNGATYYYTIYAYDAVPNYSAPVKLSAVPQTNTTQTSIVAEKNIVNTNTDTTATLPHPVGTLLRDSITKRTYYIDNGGVKRLISSPTAFSANGFSWSRVIDVSGTVLGRYADGAAVSGKIATATSTLTPVANPGQAVVVKVLGIPAAMKKAVLVKVKNTIYAIVNGKRHTISSPSLFNAYKFSWGKVKTIAASQLNKYPRVKLVKATGSPAVYYITDRGQKKTIPSATIFLAYGNKWSDVVEILPEDLAKYPDAKLIRLEGDTKIYLIEGNAKRHVRSTDVLTRMKLRMDDVVNVKRIEFDAYGTGEDVR